MYCIGFAKKKVGRDEFKWGLTYHVPEIQTLKEKGVSS